MFEVQIALGKDFDLAFDFVTEDGILGPLQGVSYTTLPLKTLRGTVWLGMAMKLMTLGSS